MPRVDVVLPDFGLAEVSLTLCSWLVEPGAEVVAGDRLVQILAGSITIDLPAPASGTLIKRLVRPDDVLQVGQVLAVIESDRREDSSTPR